MGIDFLINKMYNIIINEIKIITNKRSNAMTPEQIEALEELQQEEIIADFLDKMATLEAGIEF